jgi:hypothetical protein
MNISVEYQDTGGVISNRTYRMTRLAFAKHLGIAGQGYAPNPKKLIRSIAMFLHYSYYMQRQPFYNDRFSEPPIQFSDPTEKGQFSNLAGKAIADFLSKRIDNSIYTVNYEAAMRLRGMPLNVRRPDLIAYTQNSMFAIEAKGHAGGSGNMISHKNQSLTGGIPVNYTVACVSYDLYNNVKCNYHDPFNDNVKYDNVTLSGLTRNYYKGLSDFVDHKYFEYREINYQGEDFYEIELSQRNIEKFFPDEFPFRLFWQFEILEFLRPRLILPKKIMEYADKGITNEVKPFIFEAKEQENNIYIDNDRVGLIIGE